MLGKIFSRRHFKKKIHEMSKPILRKKKENKNNNNYVVSLASTQ